MGVTHTPDVLVGLGGGGSRVVTRLLSWDWLLEDVLSHEEGGPGTLRATVVDSATRGEDPRVPAVTERIAAARERAGLHPDDDGLSFEGPITVPDRLPEQWASPRRLGTPGSVRELCRAEGLGSWWLGLDREPLASAINHSFTEGTFRSRPLGKALYHAAAYTDTRLVPPTTDADEVAFVTTLGGGTGSGMVIDLAAATDSRRTHLYAILPHGNATDRERANAFAALSELAYTRFAGECPFDTITLLPHLEGVDADAFETAAARSVLAHQQAVQAGVAPWNPSAPFTVAAAHTVEFPVERRRRATAAMREFLERKRATLDAEADLNAHVRAYLRECFPATAGDVLDNGAAAVPPEREPDWFDLRRRIELLRERLLGSDTLDLVGSTDRVEAIRGAVDEVIEHGQAQLADGGDRQYVRTVPELLIDALETEFGQLDAGTLPAELVGTLTAALENVAERRELLEAAARITPESGLEADDAELVRAVLSADVLDPEVTYSSRTARVEDRLSAVAADVDRLRAERDDLASLHGDVAAELDTRLRELFEESRSAATLLTTVNEHGPTVSERIDELEATVADAVAALEAADTAEVASTVTLDLGSFEPLNETLSEMGVTPVPLREIEDAFGHLREARVALFEYRGGFLSSLLNTDRAAAYEDHAAVVAGTDWFEIDPPTVEGDAPFRAEFSPEPLRRKPELLARRDEAIDRVVDTFTTLFDGDEAPRFERTVGESTRLSIPDSTTPSIAAELREALERSHAEDVDTLFDRLFPTDGLHELESTAAPNPAPAAALYDAYLLPVREAHRRTVDRLRTLTGDGEQPVGTLERFELLRQLAVGESASTATLALPDSEPVSGVEFASRYEGGYEPDSAPPIDPPDAGDPYVTREPVEWGGPVPEPAAIDETDLVETQLDSITHAFADFVHDAFRNDERVPVAPLPDVEAATGDLRVSPVFLAPGAPPGSEALQALDDAVAERLHETLAGLDGNDGTAAYTTGKPTAVTAVTFVDGLELADLDGLGGPDGYRAAYERERDHRAFPGALHSIGLGGDWTTWERLGEYVTSTAESDDCGGYVYRALDGDEESRIGPFSVGLSESTIPLD